MACQKTADSAKPALTAGKMPGSQPQTSAAIIVPPPKAIKPRGLLCHINSDPQTDEMAWLRAQVVGQAFSLPTNQQPSVGGQAWKGCSTFLVRRHGITRGPSRRPASQAEVGLVQRESPEGIIPPGLTSHGQLWRGRRDSNPQPQDRQSCTLTKLSYGPEKPV